MRGFEENSLPAMREVDGYVGSAMLIDRRRSIGAVGAIFADRGAFEASRGPQAAVRAAASRAAGTVVYGLEEFDVVLMDGPG